MPVNPSSTPTLAPVDIARETFRRLALRRISPTPDAYRDVYEEVAGARPEPAANSPQPAARTMAAPGASAPESLRDMLARTLNFALASLLQATPELASEAEALAALVKQAVNEALLAEASARLRQLCYAIELRTGDLAGHQEALLQLLTLLLDNVGELLSDDLWMRSQIGAVRELLSGPLDQDSLGSATRSLKEVIYRQGVLKGSISDARAAVKTMLMRFIDRLGSMATTTGDYHRKLDDYARKIGQAADIDDLNQILDEVLRETRNTQDEALRSRDEMLDVRQEVQQAEARIRELELQLEQMGELVREDQLTGSLNRRGLDDAFQRELARADRHGSPLCIAMLDLDDFKRLNDTHGHAAGDEALIHLVRVIGDTLRSMDVIGRFGGEEFMIMLPDTPPEAACQTVTRVQRELTKRIFMHRHERLLITFSAGVALRQPGEDQASLVRRADAALYRAKREGKNRVALAE